MLLFFNYREFIVWVFLPFPDRPRIFKPLDLIHPVKTVERENASNLFSACFLDRSGGLQGWPHNTAALHHGKCPQP